MDFNWFNVSSPSIIWRCRFWKLWNAFHRVYDPVWAQNMGVPRRQWGFGIGQIGRRHLLYVGHNSLFIGFVKVR